MQNKTNSVVFVAVALAVVLLFAVTLDTSAQNEKSIERSTMHRSTISNLANELNEVADRDGGIGKELREVAKEQNNSKEKTAKAMEKVEDRGGLKTFFIGTDYKNLGDLRSAMVTTENHISRLMKAKERAADADVATDLGEQIVALQAEKNKIESFIKDNESKFSLFGWFVRLFN